MRLKQPTTIRFAANISIMFQETDFRQRFSRAKAAGFDAVECWFPYDVSPDELSDLVADSKVQLIGLNTAPGNLAAGEWGLAAVPGRENEFRFQVERAIQYAQRVGARAIHVMAGMTSDIDQATARCTYLDNLSSAAVEAERRGLTILIEPLNPVDRPGYFLSTSDQAAAVIDELSVPNVKMLFDVYHVQVAEGDILRRIGRHFEKIGHFQIAGVPSRAEPDEGEVNYRAVLKEIARLGWGGWIGCEYKPRKNTEDGLNWIQRLSIV